MARPAIAVVGAGIVGCLIARELAARDPEVLITVLDRDTIGGGASRRSAGLHLPRGATPRVRQMAAYSHGYYTDLRRRRPDLPIYQVGATVIARRPSGGPPSDTQPSDTQPSDAQYGGTRYGGTQRGRHHNEQPGGGYLALTEPTIVGQADAPVAAGKELIAVADGCRAWRLAGCHYADVYQLTQAIAADLRPRVRFLEGVAVTGLELTDAGVTVRRGAGDPLRFDRVVLAPGPWLAGTPWHDLVAPLGLRAKKIAALHIERRPGPADQAVILDDDDAFLLPLAHRGHWLFSYSCQEWDVDPDELTGGLATAQLTAASECLRRYSPALADACASGRMFCDAYSPDREPVVRELDAAGRIVFAGAANGSGYRLAPAIGSEVVDLLHVERTEGAFDDHQYV